MKFLLVALNAKYIHSNPALHSLYAYAGEKYQDSIELAEYTINNESGTILADLYQRQPDVVGFSCYIWNWNIISDIIREFHKLMPSVPIWLGGPEVSFDAGNILENKKEVTGIMIGVLLIPMIYYTYTGVFGISLDWLNIFIFFIAVAVSYYIEIKSMHNTQEMSISPEAAKYILFIVAVVFMIVTLFPPQIMLFQDPVTGTYGIEK